MEVNKTFVTTDDDQVYEPTLLQLFQALSDATRLDIVLCLLDPERGCLLKERYPIAKSTLSHHLKILREANILILHVNNNAYKYEVNTVYLRKHFPDIVGMLENYIKSNKELNSK